jgi:hypothetical protein
MATGYYLIEIFHDKRYQRNPPLSSQKELGLNVYISPDVTQ